MATKRFNGLYHCNQPRSNIGRLTLQEALICYLICYIKSGQNSKILTMKIKTNIMTENVGLENQHLKSETEIIGSFLCRTSTESMGIVMGFMGIAFVSL